MFVCVLFPRRHSRRHHTFQELNIYYEFVQLTKRNLQDDIVEFIVVSLTLLDPSKIVTRPVDQVVWVGESVTLFCNATGNPAPNISYTALGENGTVGNDKTLVINSSSMAYVKTYTCTADNGVQPPAAVNATVTVLGKSYFCLTLQDLVIDTLSRSRKLEKIWYHFQT